MDEQTCGIDLAFLPLAALMVVDASVSCARFQHRLAC